MKRAAFLFAAGLLIAAVAIPQDLPPGALLLSRVRRHIKQELERLPNISCLQTVHREHRPAGGKMRPLDTIRLEVLTNGNKELFASPGDRKFSEGHPISYAGAGALGNGYFGVYLRSILVTSNVSHEYKGEEVVGGRRLARFDYRLPLMWSGQTIQTAEGSGAVSLHGSYWVDPQTYDVTRLELSADDFPPALPVTEAVTSINYARTGVGDLVVLLPESVEFRMVKFSGEISHNRIEFTHCRAFGAQSKIDFGPPDAVDQTPRFAVASVDDTLRPLPAGLQIAVKLRSGISPDMAVGSLIDAVVAASLPAEGAVVITAGSPVRGRIRRLERYTEPYPYFVVALEFIELELQGIRYRFYADLVDIDPAPGIHQAILTGRNTVQTELAFAQEVRSTSETLWLPNLPGVATFFFKGGKLDLPQGLRTVWKTRPVQ